MEIMTETMADPMLEARRYAQKVAVLNAHPNRIGVRDDLNNFRAKLRGGMMRTTIEELIEWGLYSHDKTIGENLESGDSNRHFHSERYLGVTYFDFFKDLDKAFDECGLSRFNDSSVKPRASKHVCVARKLFRQGYNYYDLTS